ncbi:MAG: acyl-CoA dehydrogenase family protein [Gammaproteobacteria bacterium]|nr:acyl-CoA dehydrogenase family protein [Gammaproteobacteria bacterium]
MDFTLSEDQLAYQNTAKQFALQEMAPYAKEWDEEHIFPIDTLRKAALLGFAGICMREDVGGSQLTRLDSALIFEELATGCVSTAAYLSIHNMVGWLIDQYASEELRLHWLPKFASMDVLSSYCLTEPGSGSDAASLKTTAVRDGDYFILNGTKAFISGGSVSDVYACMVRTGGEGPKGISCILVEKNTTGLSFGKKEMKLGWHSQPTTMVFFENCRVPASNLIGNEGQGFNIALSALNGGRINIAACSLGGAKTCLSLARDHMLQRQQFKKKLVEFEALQFKFADMITDLEAARLMVHKAADSLHHNHPQAAMYCAMAKRLATDTGFQICNDALQIFGGYGYTCEYPIERYFRDLRVHQILEGTNEIMRLIISRNALDESFLIM